MKDPLQGQAEVHEWLIEDVEGLNKPRHGVHGDPGGKHGHECEGAGVPGAGLLVKAQAEKFGDGAGLGAVVERHHEDADEDHRGDGADPIELADDDAVLGARSAHADDFLGAEVGGDESQTADPGRQGATGLQVILAGFHETFECEANAQHENEIQQHDQPVDGCQVHAVRFLPGKQRWQCRRPLYTVALGQVQMKAGAAAGTPVASSKLRADNEQEAERQSAKGRSAEVLSKKFGQLRAVSPCPSETEEQKRGSDRFEANRFLADRFLANRFLADSRATAPA